MATAGWLSGVLGSEFFIGTTAVNAQTDSYVRIGILTQVSEFGRSYEVVTFTNLVSRNAKKFKKGRDDGGLTLDVLRTKTDAGQEAAKVALDQDDDYNFKFVLDDANATPTTVYFKAMVVSYPRKFGGPNDVVGGRFVLAVATGSVIEIAAT
jgi:hypothetical protein